MSMTLEEAIAVLAESKRQNEVMRDNPSTFWVSHQMADGVKNAERRISALDMALSALRPVSREQVEKVWRGEWQMVSNGSGVCSECHRQDKIDPLAKFCRYCGVPMTDEAVEMVMERMDELQNEIG